MDPAGIGLTAGQISDLTTQTAQARENYDLLVAQKAAARNATQVQKDLNAFRYDLDADLVKTIRVYAQTIDGPNVCPPRRPPTYEPSCRHRSASGFHGMVVPPMEPSSASGAG